MVFFKAHAYSISFCLTWSIVQGFFCPFFPEITKNNKAVPIKAKIKRETKIPEISAQKFKIMAEHVAAELLALNGRQIWSYGFFGFLVS